MKKLLPIVALSLMMTDSAIAGTMGVDVAPTSWTGIYAGANGGSGLATAASSMNLNLLINIDSPSSFSVASHELNGFLAGGQAGYNYQFRHFLFGFEGDGDWTNIQGVAPCAGLFSCSANLRWTADATGRLGVLPTNDLLVYVKGGVVWSGVNYVLNSSGALGSYSVLSSSLSTTKTGGLIGIGTEYLFAPHWTAKIEYNYADYGTYTNNFLITETLTKATMSVMTPVSTILQMHAVKAGINYRI